MATYLQGVTDYIPQFQPFQPDLNFYGNVMQTKQTQYDTNWKSLNKMYGQYYNADLTRDSNVAKKDNYLKQIEFNLQKVSQLDLSLEQNVDQATQIFKPFYEDKGLMKDMAFTKNNMSQVGYGESLKNAYDQKEREQYWDDGIAELNFKREEFKEASEADAMSFENTTYTPYVNAIERAQDVAKEAGLSIESVDFSKDGKWLVKTKNGEQLIEPLQKLFEARLGNDSGIQGVYKTQSYVNRKSYAQANAAQYGGDKNAAEMKYLENSFNVLKSQNVARYNGLKQTSLAYSSKIKDIEKQIEDGTASPEAKMSLDQYKMNKDINDQVLVRAENEQKELSSGQSTATTSTGFVNPYGDLKSLRYKVDNGMASLLMQKDLDEAANIFAFKDAKQDLDANPYAVLADKHRYSMQEVAARNAGLERAAILRNQGEDQKMKNEYRLKAGTHYINEETGEVLPVEALNEMFVDPDDKGTSTDKLNLKKASKYISELNTSQIATPYLQNTLALVDRLVSEGQMSSQEASKILGYSKNPNISVDNFSKKLNKYGSNFIRNEVGSKDLARIETKMSSWLSQNGELSGLSGDDYKNYQENSLKFKDYTGYLKADADWRKTTSFEVEKDLRRKGYKNVDYLYDNKGNLRSEKEYYDILAKNNLLTKDDSRFEKKKIKELTPLSGIQRILGYGADETEVGPSRATTDYKELVSEAAKTYTSGRIKSPLPGLTELPGMKGTGLASLGKNSTLVNPKSHGSKSSIWMGEVFKDLSKMDWGDSTKNRVTFQGISKTNWEGRGGENNRNGIGKAIFEQIRSELSNPKTSMGNFRIDVAPIATGSLSKSAIVIHPDAKWLKQYVKTGKDGAGSGLLTEGLYNDILENGISYITDSKNMTNSMYKAAFQSPLQSYVDYYGKYTYSDPTNSKYKMSITKNKLGTGDYTITNSFPIWDPNEETYKYHTYSDNLTTFGTNLESGRGMAVSQWEEYKTYNKQLKNGNY